MIKRLKTKLNSESGFSLIEVLIAVAMFAAVTVPLMSGFVMSARLNLKARNYEQGMSTAQSIMEGVKSIGIGELSREVNTNSITFISSSTTMTGTEEFLVADGASYENGAFVGKTIKETKTITEADNITVANIDDPEHPTVITGTYEVDANPYVFWIRNITQGTTEYYVKITLTQQKNPEVNVAFVTNSEDANSNMTKLYASAYLTAYKSYDVTIDVYSTKDDEHWATYTGSIKDNSI